MIDLGVMLREMQAGLSPPDPTEISGFSGSADDRPERQVAEIKHISGISGISGGKTQKLVSGFENSSQGRAHVGARERACDLIKKVPETPETPVKPVPARNILSGSLSSKPEMPEKRERLTSTGLIDLPVDDGLALWRAGLSRLVTIDPVRSPIETGYRTGEWARVYTRMLDFLDRFGEQAEALGWTAPRLFGVHPEIGIIRADRCGALVLPVGGMVRAVTATEIALGQLTYREKLGQALGVAIWEFGR